MTRSFEMIKVSSAVFVREKKGKEKREGQREREEKENRTAYKDKRRGKKKQ